MVPLKTLISNTNQLKRYSDKPYLIFFARQTNIVAFRLFKTLDGVEIQDEIHHAISDSLLETIPEVVDKMKMEKTSRYKCVMVLDDAYLNTHRIQINANDQNNIHPSLELEIDDLNEYAYDVSPAPKEVKNMITLIVFLIKKTNLTLIEKAFLSKKLLLRRLVSRYHAIESLLCHDVFDLDPKKPAVLVDVGETRVRLFITVNHQVKLYRRMPIRFEKTAKKKSMDHFLSAADSFLKASMDSFLLKFSEYRIDHIYIVSDFLDASSLKKGQKINGLPILNAPVKPELYDSKSVKDAQSFLYAYGFFLMIYSKNKFNIIPFMKRFETFGIRIILGVFLVGVVAIVGNKSLAYVKLNKEYAKYKANKSSQMLMQAKKKREMVELRERINKQKKIIDYADLTTKAYHSDVSIDDFLFDLTSISSSDIRFTALRIRNKKVTLTGTCSSLNGNYSFYVFLQQLEGLPYLGRIHYSLGLSGGIDSSSFTIEVFWEENG